ncbi:quinon protein alcohol dehydrogenase-like superfamily [Coprinopsis sp. MPI-PUGE-AT-0042]|nr:quinon protein alcohol dehydrogenase-like superfamily [Coprinopsis sp. MPI-PUGE-AT-0042]
MSFLKKVGRKLGARRKIRAEAHDEATSPPETRREEIEVQAADETRGIGDVCPAPLDVRRPSKVEADAENQSTSQIAQRNEQRYHPAGNQFSISGGTFNNAGRDVISQTYIHSQYINEKPRDSRLFEVLSPVPAAHDCEVVSSKVSECFAGTRQQLLHDIEVWRTAGSVPIFILDGIAGIGKSTIVKSVCAQAAAERSLAASWFFSRDEQDRKTTRGFVRTLAYQLASHHPTLRNRISEVLQAQPDILQKAIRMQFDALVHEPLRGVFENQSETHTISIDAIDECNLTEAVELLSILLNSIPQHPALRLLVTCRPERPFRLLLQQYHGPRVFHLHEIENSVVQADIRLYINHCLSPAQIDKALPDLLPPRWRASPDEIAALVQMAGKLFIVASTAISFILDPLRLAPAKQMAQLLDAKSGATLAGEPMDHLYIQVLRAAVPKRVGDWFEDYQAVVGSIVVAADVLSTQSLASLLDMDPNGIVGALSHLHSLIAPTRDSDAFHVHHKSFPDFVTDKSRCAIDSRFYIEASARHFHLAQHCLRIMIKLLKPNICELPRSEWDVESSNLPSGTIKDRIPPEVAYACAYWILHMQEGLPHLINRGDVIDQLKIFIDRHLLSWLEVLALTNRFDTAWGDVSVLSESIDLTLELYQKKLFPVASAGTLSNLEHVASVLRDLLRFISFHPELPRRLPMHVYLSALPFIPSESKIRHLYANSASNTTHSIAVVSGLEQNWDPISVTFRERPKAMDLSPCGTMIATRSSRVRLYNAKSGQLLQSLGSEVSVDNTEYASVAFSSDSRCIASTTSFGVQIWDVISGELVGNCCFPGSPLPDDSESKHVIEWEWEPYLALKPDRMHATSLIFTLDGTSIAAGTADGRLLIWNMVEPEAVLLQVVDDPSSSDPCQCKPEGIDVECPAHGIEGLVALPDSPILLGVTQSAVIFWDRITHKCLETIPRCAVGVRDQRRLISPPISVSLNKEMVVIDCDPFLISIYSVRTQHRLCNLSGHQGIVTTTAFAPHNHLCSASEDRTVRLWDVTTASQLKCIQIADVLRHSVFSVTLGTFILSPESAQQGRMVRLVRDECIVFGPSHFRGWVSWGPQPAADGSMIASYNGNSVMVANVLDFIELPAHTNNLELSQPQRFGYLPSGQVVALRFVEKLGNPWQTLEVTGVVNITIRESALKRISHDMSRAAIIDKELDPGTLWIYDVRSGRQEFRLSFPPLAQDESPRCRVRFSSDSSTVYLEWADHKFYAACLPSESASRQDVSFTPGAFLRLEDTPTPHWVCLQAIGLPRVSELHFLAQDSAWVLNDDKTWNQIHLPSLPFKEIQAIAYSRNGALVAIVLAPAGPIEGMNIQIRSLPNYNLTATLRDHRHDIWVIRFLDHHVLIACSRLGFTCWDAMTGQRVGQCFSQLGSLFSFAVDVGSRSTPGI